MAKKLSLLEILAFEWDKGNLEHIQKHKAEYTECEQVFYNNPVFFYDEAHSLKEDRFLAYGVTDEERTLILVFTIRNRQIRVISARNQNKKEKEVYIKSKGGD